MFKASISVESLGKAADALKTGGVVAFPTETVYGLAADAASPAAVAALYALKGRGEGKPCQVLVAAQEEAFRLGKFSPQARALAEQFWPGPLTLIVRRRENAPVSDAVSAGADTLGLRVPGHGTTLSLLKRFGGPLAATSANPAGLPPALTAAEAATYFPQLLILEGGAAAEGIASTIVDCTEEEMKIVREGTITASVIASVAKQSRL